MTQDHEIVTQEEGELLKHLSGKGYTFAEMQARWADMDETIDYAELQQALAAGRLQAGVR